MALNERLQILVTADGKGAVNEFSRIGAAAEKELGKTDDRIARMSSGLISSGTQIALAGGVATAGVFALAQAAGDYEEAASAAGVIFGDSAEDIERFGKEAINTAGLSRRAAVDAANTFGTFGKAANLTGDDLAEFSIELTNLAGDLASFRNTSTEEAIEAIGAALRGESEPIRKYGVLLDDATLKQRAMELGIYDGVGALDQQSKVLAAQAEILAQTSDAQGDFARTSDSLSNQTRSFTAEIENLKVGLGEGAVPVFSELVGAANDALAAFQNLSPETQDVVGKIGAIGAVGVTAIGGLSVIAGGVLNLVNTFGTLRAGLRDAEGNLTRTGQVATTAGKVIGGAVAVGGVLLLADALFQLTQNAGNAQTALDKFKVEAPKGDAEQTLALLNSLGASYRDLGDAIIEPLVDEGVIKTSDDFGVSIGNVDRAINDLLKSGNVEGARLALEALEDVRLRPDNAEVLGEIDRIIADYTPRVNAASEATGGLAVELDKVGPAASRGADLITGVSEANVDFAANLDETNKLLKLSGDLFDLSAQRAQGFLSAIEDSSAIDDLLGASLDLRDSSKALLDGIGALAGVNVEEVASGFGEISDEAAEALRDVLALGDDAQASIAAALQFQGADAARGKADQIRDGLVGMLQAAGVADDQIQYLLETIGLTPEQVETAIVVSGTDEAIAKLTLLRDFYTNADGSSGIPDEINTQVGVAIAEGRFVDAANLISLWVKDQEDGSIDDPLLIAMGLGDTTAASGEVEAWKNSEEAKPPVDVPVGANTQPGVNTVQGFLNFVTGQRPSITVDVFTRFADQGLGAFPIFGRRAMGGPVTGDRPYLVGEEGPELFVPQSSGTVLSNGDTAAALSGGSTQNVTVNQTIVTPDPVVAGSESARKMRDASYLVSV